MTTTLETDDPTITLRGPHDLLAALPFHCGFRPTASVVIACTTAQHRLGLVARIGIEDLTGPDPATVLETLARAVADERPELCTIVLYADEADAVARGAVAAVQGAVGDVGPTDCWWVGPDRYRSLDCEDPACCPPGGHPTAALDHGEVAAMYVLAGHRAAPSRDDAYRIPPADRTRRQLTSRAARRHEIARDRCGDDELLRRWRCAALDSWRRAVRAAVPPSREDGAPELLPPALLGRVAAALDDRRVRDAILLTLVPGAQDAAEGTVRAADDALVDVETGRALARVVDPDHAVRPEVATVAPAATVLEQLVAHAPRGRGAPASTLLAFLAWWRGDGPRASYRAAEALAADPEYRLAHLLHSVLVAAVPPGWVRVGRDGADHVADVMGAAAVR